MGYKLPEESRERLVWRLQTLGRMEHCGGSPTQMGALVRGMLKAKGRRGRKVMFHSAQRVPLQPNYPCGCGGYSRGRDSVLEVLAGCSSLDAASVPRLQHTPQEGFG